MIKKKRVTLHVQRGPHNSCARQQHSRPGAQTNKAQRAQAAEHASKLSPRPALAGRKRCGREVWGQGPWGYRYRPRYRTRFPIYPCRFLMSAG